MHNCKRGCNLTVLIAPGKAGLIRRLLAREAAFWVLVRERVFMRLMEGNGIVELVFLLALFDCATKKLTEQLKV